MAIVANQKITQFLGKDTVLECYVEGSPIPDMEWFRNGQKINDTDRYSLDLHTVKEDYTLSLTIRYLEPGDFGEYTCRAENIRGHSEASISLEPLGKNHCLSTLKQNDNLKYFIDVRKKNRKHDR